MPRHPTPALQPLAAATAINLKRLLSAQDAAAGGQTGDPTTRAAAITALSTLLARAVNEIDRLAAAGSSTGS